MSSTASSGKKAKQDSDWAVPSPPKPNTKEQADDEEKLRVLSAQALLSIAPAAAAPDDGKSPTEHTKSPPSVNVANEKDTMPPSDSVANDKDTASDMPSKDVVLFGKDDSEMYRSHAGNRKYRALIHVYCDEYGRATNEKKVELAKKVVSNILTNGGSFAERDSDESEWQRMDYTKAVQMTLVVFSLSLQEENQTRKRNKNTDIKEEELKNDDVLCFQGNRYNKHKGNVAYRKAVRQCVKEYKLSNLGARFYVARNIVDVFVNKDGRFLEKDIVTGNWNKLSYNHAVKMVENDIWLKSKPTAAAKKARLAASQKGKKAAKKAKSPPTPYIPADFPMAMTGATKSSSQASVSPASGNNEALAETYADKKPAARNRARNGSYIPVNPSNPAASLPRASVTGNNGTLAQAERAGTNETLAEAYAVKKPAARNRAQKVAHIPVNSSNPAASLPQASIIGNNRTLVQAQRVNMPVLPDAASIIRSHMLRRQLLASYGLAGAANLGAANRVTAAGLGGANLRASNLGAASRLAANLRAVNLGTGNLGAANLGANLGASNLGAFPFGNR